MDASKKHLILIDEPDLLKISSNFTSTFIFIESFVVMSWNVLSPRLCHASRLDAGCDATFLDWDYRKGVILNQIAFTDADIVCLQVKKKNATHNFTSTEFVMDTEDGTFQLIGNGAEGL
jgi:mRNA deadenylase 3'-5' endonuclease subunit Ccr4